MFQNNNIYPVGIFKGAKDKSVELKSKNVILHRYCLTRKFPSDTTTTRNLARLKSQVIDKAILIFEATHPGCIALFAFDNATSHADFVNDVLVASKMNYNDGESQPKMRDAVFNDAE
ncbi:1692_t:CDS:2 [Entrophospora sp. SA101]|nr:1692_t:CDS:2 [Entrophospora sp. SA101]